MSSKQCPECGYPDTKDGQHFKGIYKSGMPCPHCQFFQGRITLEEVAENLKVTTSENKP